MEQKASKFHSLVMLGLCVYAIGGTGLMVYGLINQTTRPYVIAFIVVSLLFSVYGMLTAPLQTPAEELPKK